MSRIIGILLVLVFGVIFASTAFAETDAPTFIDIGSGKAFLIENNREVISFGYSPEGEAAGEYLFLTDYIVMEWSPECEYDLKSQPGLVCPYGYFTATVDVEITGDIFTGFTLYQDGETLYTRIFPVVESEGVTPYRVQEIDRTFDAISLQVLLYNNGPKDFLGEVVIYVDPPGDHNDNIYEIKDMSLPVGVSTSSDTIIVPFEGDGYYFVSVRIGGIIYDPLGFDILHKPERVFMPIVRNE